MAVYLLATCCQGSDDAAHANSPCRLLQNYEYEEGHSLSRQSVYEAYEEFCRQTGQPAHNNASFGKLIRAVFPELKTRRLGTRGNSKVCSLLSTAHET